MINDSENKQSIEDAFKNEIINSNAKEVLVEGGELMLDSLLEEGIIKQIPFLGVLYKTSKAAMGIREMIFAKKVLMFLSQLQDISSEEKQKFIYDIESKPGYNDKVGEKLILLLDAMDDMGKPKILASLLTACIKGEISYDDFTRLGSVVLRIHLKDMLELKCKGVNDVSEYTRDHLVAIGILGIHLVKQLFLIPLEVFLFLLLNLNII